MEINNNTFNINQVPDVVRFLAATINSNAEPSDISREEREYFVDNYKESNFAVLSAAVNGRRNRPLPETTLNDRITRLITHTRSENLADRLNNMEQRADTAATPNQPAEQPSEAAHGNGESHHDSEEPEANTDHSTTSTNNATPASSQSAEHPAEGGEPHHEEPEANTDHSTTSTSGNTTAVLISTTAEQKTQTDIDGVEEKSEEEGSGTNDGGDDNGKEKADSNPSDPSTAIVPLKTTLPTKVEEPDDGTATETDEAQSEDGRVKIVAERVKKIFKELNVSDNIKKLLIEVAKGNKNVLANIKDLAATAAIVSKAIEMLTNAVKKWKELRNSGINEQEIKNLDNDIKELEAIKENLEKFNEELKKNQELNRKKKELEKKGNGQGNTPAPKPVIIKPAPKPVIIKPAPKPVIGKPVPHGEPKAEPKAAASSTKPVQQKSYVDMLKIKYHVI